MNFSKEFEINVMAQVSFETLQPVKPSFTLHEFAIIGRELIDIRSIRAHINSHRYRTISILDTILIVYRSYRYTLSKCTVR